MTDTVVVVAGGSAPLARALEAIPPGSRVIAADRGADHALALGLRVELAIGDFDSATPAALEALATQGARIEEHPVDKDATDLELALLAALDLRPSRILVIGGIEGRLDHLLGELVILGADQFERVEMDAILGGARVHVIRGERALSGTDGELISLFALNGPATGISTEGLAYPLCSETLTPGSSRGISNRFAAAEAGITLESGLLLAVRP
ncbi:MAG: thiamine diphosphokinase [Actinobacteria bacterium]|nr:thiamine diphosphokinase [Actinomycetota bacterium]